MVSLKASIYLPVLLLGLAASQSQTLAADLIASPKSLWSQQLFGAVGGNAQVEYGNGLFITPDGSEVVAIASDGKVASYRATDGEPMWDHDPAAEVASASGITFTTAATSTNYMVYSLTYKAADESGTDYTVVVKRDMAGNLLNISPTLGGGHSGSPVVSDDGNNVFLTHNSLDLSTGYFSILNAELEIVVTKVNNNGAFGPPGIYHNPEEGFYDAIPGLADGTMNSNDIVMWSLTPQTLNAAVQAGRIFAFQFQTDFDVDFDDVASLNYFSVGSDRAFQTITPPVITNKGRSVYWSASRSEYFCFIGNPGVNRARFNRNPNLKHRFQKNSQWPGQPIFSAPAVATDENGGAVVFGGSASNEFFRFTNDFEGTEGDASKVIVAPSPTTIETSTLILASPIIDPMQRVVYYVESGGVLHQANYDTIEDIWTESIADGVQGTMAINKEGSVLYVMSVDGRVLALTVAGEDITDAPTLSPVQTPAPSTGAPTAFGVTAAPVGTTLAPSVTFPPQTDPPTQEPPTREPETSVDDTGSAAFAKSIQLAAASLVWIFLL